MGRIWSDLMQGIGMVREVYIESSCIYTRLHFLPLPLNFACKYLKFVLSFREEDYYYFLKK